MWTSPKEKYAEHCRIAPGQGQRSMQRKGSGVDKPAADPHDDGPAPFANAAIIQFGIFCCAVTMVIVFAVAVAAS